VARICGRGEVLRPFYCSRNLVFTTEGTESTEKANKQKTAYTVLMVPYLQFLIKITPFCFLLTLQPGSKEKANGQKSSVPSVFSGVKAFPKLD